MIETIEMHSRVVETDDRDWKVVRLAGYDPLCWHLRCALISLKQKSIFLLYCEGFMECGELLD